MIRTCERWFLPLLILIALSTVISAQSPIPQGTPPPQSYLPSGGVAWVYAVGALASAVASVIAWRAKLGFSREFAAAKDAHIATLEEARASLREKTEETIKALNQTITSLEKAQDETIKAKDERLATSREQIEMLKTFQDERIKTKDDAIAELKTFLSPEFMRSIAAQKEQLQQIVEEKNKDIEKLQGQVRERPLDATDLALRKDKLELEQQIIALTQAYAMKVSSQSLSKLGVSVKDEGKIESALRFLDRLGSTEAGYSQRTTEEAASAAHSDGERTSREPTEDLTESHK